MPRKEKTILDKYKLVATIQDMSRSATTTISAYSTAPV